MVTLLICVSYTHGTGGSQARGMGAGTRLSSLEAAGANYISKYSPKGTADRATTRLSSQFNTDWQASSHYATGGTMPALPVTVGTCMEMNCRSHVAASFTMGDVTKVCVCTYISA
jgi:hypothetical protein